MRVLTLEIIVWIIGSVYFILTPHLASSTLAGSNYSICIKNFTRTEIQEEVAVKWGWKWLWIVPYYWFDTEMKLVNKTINNTQEQVCCEGFTNINETCLRDDQIKPYQEFCKVHIDWCEQNKASESQNDPMKYPTISPQCTYISEDFNELGELCNRLKNCTATGSKSCWSKYKSKWCTKKNVCGCHFNFKINNTDTQCVPLCDNKCKHGHCVAKNKCNCDKGWEGVSCEVAARCRLVENDAENRVISDNSTSFWELPICHPGCRDKISGTIIQEKRTILINSTCNAEVMGFLIIHGQWICLTSALIVLVCFITCIACCIKKIKKSAGPSSGLELIPSTTTNHMEENDLYATTKTTF